MGLPEGGRGARQPQEYCLFAISKVELVRGGGGMEDTRRR